MLNKIKNSVFGFVHPDSIAAAVKVIIAWQAQPNIVQGLALLGIKADWIKHEMVVFAAILWGVDRIHRAYGDSKTEIIPAPKV